MKPSTVTELNAFSGGMNTVTAPYLIAPDESTLLVNVDVRRGAMWSTPRILRHSEATHPYFFQFEHEVYFHEDWRSNVIWDNKWYWSDGVTTGKVLPDGTELPLGIPTPTVRPTATPDGTVGDGPHSGDMKYCYTFYNNNTGTESAPSPLTPYVTPDEQDVIVDNFEALPSEATHYRIYRIGGYLPYFMVVDTIEPGDLPYTDNLDDTQIDGRLLQTMRNGPPPQTLHYLTEMNGRMYGAVGNTLYFSALGNPDSWYIYDVIPCKDSIRGIAKVPGGLLVLGLDWCNVLKGTDPTNFALQVVSDKVGMVDASSLNYIDQVAIWLSNHGVVMSDGYTIKQLTADKIENIAGIHPSGSEVLNNVYYMTFRPILVPLDTLFPSDSLYPGTAEGTGGLSEGCLVIDFKRGNGYSFKLIDYPNMVYLDTLDGEVGVISGNYNDFAFECYTVGFPDCNDYLRCSGFELGYLTKYDANLINELHRWATIDYISPVLVDGSTTTLKQYDKVRIVYKGTFKVQVFFDNDRMVMERVLENTEGFEFLEELIGIPNEDNLAYSIRFRVTGVGIVKGIQYSWQNRNQT